MAKLKPKEYLPGMELIGVNEDVDIANAKGEVFRNIPNKVTLAQGATYTYRFSNNIKSKLLSRVLTMLSGHMVYEVITEATETNVGAPIVLACTNSEIATVPTNVMRGGVTITGGTVVDTVEALTGVGAGQASLPDAQIGGRVLGANQTFWLRLTGVATSSSAILNLLIREYL